MATSIRVILLALAGVFIAAATSFAEPAADAAAADAAAKWGLLGTWRIDCSTSATRKDPDLVFVVVGDQLFHRREWGLGRDSNAVLSAAIKEDGAIELLVRFERPAQTRQWVYVKQADGRIRVQSNKDVNTDEYTVREGKFLATGNTTPWQTRCR